ncbi:MAG TPA: GatB/YqeY domain-containing protein [Chloroflexi bacterium]|nr:GatB/YqeY domain-containing protein [Chloroflexota bacterium]
MGLKARLQEDLKEALRARDERRKAVIRMCLTAIQLAEVEHGGELDEATVVSVLQKEVRRRKETIEELRGADRPERLAEEEAELAILESYLPRMLTREEIAAEAREVIAQVGASSLRDLGAVMRVLMPQMKGRADGRLVNEVVRELLSE